MNLSPLYREFYGGGEGPKGEFKLAVRRFAKRVPDHKVSRFVVAMRHRLANGPEIGFIEFLSVWEDEFSETSGQADLRSGRHQVKLTSGQADIRTRPEKSPKTKTFDQVKLTSGQADRGQADLGDQVSMTTLQDPDQDPDPDLDRYYLFRSGEKNQAVKPQAPSPTDFQGFWLQRPVNQDRPESRLRAEAAYNRAVQTHGSSVVHDSLATFIADEQSKRLPRHLTTLLSDDDLLKHYAASNRPLDQALVLGFNVCWTAYGLPPLQDQRELGNEIARWARLIQDPVAFYAAIRSYRPDDERYRQAWDNFLAGGWQKVDNHRFLEELLVSHGALRPLLTPGAKSSLAAATDALRRYNDPSTYGRPYWDPEVGEVDNFTGERGQWVTEVRPGFRWAQACAEDCECRETWSARKPCAEGWVPFEQALRKESPEELVSSVWKKICSEAVSPKA